MIEFVYIKWLVYRLSIIFNSISKFLINCNFSSVISTSDCNNSPSLLLSSLDSLVSLNGLELLALKFA